MSGGDRTPRSCCKWAVRAGRPRCEAHRQPLHVLCTRTPGRGALSLQGRGALSLQRACPWFGCAMRPRNACRHRTATLRADRVGDPTAPFPHPTPMITPAPRPAEHDRPLHLPAGTPRSAPRPTARPTEAPVDIVPDLVAECVIPGSVVGIGDEEDPSTFRRLD